MLAGSLNWGAFGTFVVLCFVSPFVSVVLEEPCGNQAVGIAGCVKIYLHESRCSACGESLLAADFDEDAQTLRCMHCGRVTAAGELRQPAEELRLVPMAADWTTEDRAYRRALES
jgi:hypothetical protein